MKLKVPQDDEKFSWTRHSLNKMFYYGISATKVKNIIFRPKRKEEGIAPNTIAVMQSGGSKKNPYETWVMYQMKIQNSKVKSKKYNSFQTNKKQLIIISTWKYPGISNPNQSIPIPEDIREELLKNLL